MGPENFAESYTSYSAAWADNIGACWPVYGWHDFYIYGDDGGCKEESPQCYNVLAYASNCHSSGFCPCSTVPPSYAPLGGQTFMFFGGPGSYNNPSCHN